MHVYSYLFLFKFNHPSYVPIQLDHVSILIKDIITPFISLASFSECLASRATENLGYVVLERENLVASLLSNLFADFRLELGNN